MPTLEFSHERMYTYIKGYAAALGWTDVLNALAFARRAHGGQARKDGQPYIVHPLTMACHALALGIKDQTVIAGCLLHDVCEDCGVNTPAMLDTLWQRSRILSRADSHRPPTSP